MAVTGGSNNQTKALGGSNPISLVGNTNNGIKGFFGGKTNAIRFGQYYRNTDKDTTKSDFDDNSNNIFVPDATENGTVPTSGAISFSDFRGASDNGVIREYVVTQSGSDEELLLSAPGNWNVNLNKNIPKRAIISGRCYSTAQGSGADTYDHANDAALQFEAEAYNLDIDVDSGVNSQSDPNSASNFSNGPRGIFGVGGAGGNNGNGILSSDREGIIGGTAMYVRQYSNRSGASAIININSGNGRIYAGGGGGKGGYDGNSGNASECYFLSNKSVKIHGGNGATIRQFPSCVNKGGSCGNQTINSIAGTATNGYSCSGSSNRTRCRGEKGGNRDRGEHNCFGTINKMCVFIHEFAGNSGNKGQGGDGGRGQGSQNINTGVGLNSPNSGNAGSCNDPTSGTYTITTANAGTAGNDGNDATGGGTYGAAAGNSAYDGKGGHAVYSNTKSQVKLSNTTTNKGRTNNVTT